MLRLQGLMRFGHAVGPQWASQLPHSSAASHVTLEYDVEVTSIQSRIPKSATTTLAPSNQSAPGSAHQPSSWPPNLAQATASRSNGNSRQGNATSPTAVTAPPEQSAPGFVHQQSTSSCPLDIAKAGPSGNRRPGGTTSDLAEGSNAQHGDVSQPSPVTFSRSGTCSNTQHGIDDAQGTVTLSTSSNTQHVGADGQGNVTSSNTRHGIADGQSDITSARAEESTAQRDDHHTQGDITTSRAEESTAQRDEPPMQGNVALSKGQHGNADRLGDVTCSTAQEGTAWRDETRMQGDATCNTGHVGIAQLDEDQMQGSASQEDGQWPVTVHLSNGKSYGADLVISAIGVQPNTAWLPDEIRRDEKDGGICVDRYIICPCQTVCRLHSNHCVVYLYAELLENIVCTNS